MKEIPATQRIFAAKQGGRWGLLSKEGAWVVTPTFADIGFPTLDRFPARKPDAGIWELYSLSGRRIHSLPPGISAVGFPGERLRAYQAQNGWGFIDEDGGQVIEPRFKVFLGHHRGSRLLEFVSGQAAIMIDGGSPDGVYGSLWLGLIGRDGSWIVEPAPSYQAFGDGSLVIYPNDGPTDDPPWGIDVRPLGQAEGPELRVSFSLADELDAFRYGFAPFGADPSVGRMRERVDHFPSSQSHRSSLRWGLIDVHGNVIVPAVHEEIRSFSDGFAPFRSEGRWGFLEAGGRTAIRPAYVEVEHFAQGCAACQAADGGWGLINDVGEWLLAPTFDLLVSEQRPFR